MAYTLDEFWVPRFQGLVRPTVALPLAGWTVEPAVNPFFVEADLSLRHDSGGLDSPIWFVAAPGAVGKSTLAREISARTGAVYLDLARADTVAGYYLAGGLDRNGLSGAWERGEAAVVIDALDEARMRVPEESFWDFLRDVVEKAGGRDVPTVLFGRMGVVEEAREVLFFQDLECPVLDIDFFDQPRSVRFVLGALNRLKDLPAYDGLAGRLAAHSQVYEEVAARFVEKLAIATASDAARFAGYAPVLEAVANVLAGVPNMGKLQGVPEALQQQALQHLVQRIMEREAEKLREQVKANIPNTVRQTLYTPEEQLGRVVSKVFNSAEPPMPENLPQHLVAAYEQALRSCIEQHPFLDGTGRHPSGVVFAATITASALLSSLPDVVESAVRHASQAPQTPNPFLIEFYLQELGGTGSDTPFVLPEHIVLLHESMQARAGAGQIVQLSVEGQEDDDAADVEILHVDVKAEDASHRILKCINLRSTQAGALHFGRQVSRVTVDAPQLDVVIRSGSQVEIITPVSISVARLTLDCPELVVLAGEKRAGGGDGTAILEAHERCQSKVNRAPVVREGATLQVSWPGASGYPWSGFQGTGDNGDEPDIHDALGGLRRLVMAFRAHGQGELARYKHKIEHARMTKGALGEAIREHMLRDQILSLRGNLYFLDPDRLGHIVGANYQDVKLKRFSQPVRDYVAAIVRHNQR